MESQAVIRPVPGLFSHIRDRREWVGIYVAGITALGVAVMAAALANVPTDWPGLLLFGATAALSELCSVELFVSSRGTRVSLSSAIAIASILYFGPLAGVLVQMVTGLVAALTSTLWSRRQRADQASWMRRAAFNTGMFVIASAAAGTVFMATGGTPGNAARAFNVVPLVAAGITDIGVNLAILIGILTLQTGRSPLVLWHDEFKWNALVSVLGDVLGGGMLALSCQQVGPLGSMFFLLPILSTGYSFRRYLANTRQYVTRLEQENVSLDGANLGLLEALGAVVDAYDFYTYGHSAQVALYAEAIAEKMGLPQEEQVLVGKAALIHDVGKVSVTDSIVNKQGPLTVEEFKLIKRHPGIGAEIVAQMKGLEALVPLVRYHHERWDGKGYPDGLSETRIPLGARILALADYVDVMCSDRPYRPTGRLADVVADVQRCAGANFDPEVVEAFVQVTGEKGPDFFRNSAAVADRAITITSMPNAGAVTRYLKRTLLE